MTVSVLRPQIDSVKKNITHSTGSNASALIDDGGAVTDFTGADDATYVRVPAGAQYPNGYLETTLTDLAALASDQRILRLRIRGRVRMHTAVAGDAAIINARLWDHNSPKGAQPANPIDEWVTSNASVFQPKYGVWHTAPPLGDGAEWTRTVVNRLKLHLAWYYGNFGSENLRLSEAYVDVDVRGQASVGGVTVENAGVTTRPTVGWVFSANADNDPQVAYQVKIYTSAQVAAAGFSPDKSPPVWYSGQRRGGVSATTVGTDLAAGGTYRAYVRAAADFNGQLWYSAWAFGDDFTVTPAPPPVPSLAVTNDPSLPWYRNILSVQAFLNLLAEDDASIEETTGSWAVTLNAGIVRTAATALDGSVVLKITYLGVGTPEVLSSSTLASQVGSSIPISGSTQYTAVASLRAVSTVRTFKIVIIWKDSGGATIGSFTGTGAADTTGGWTEITATATSPSNARHAIVDIQMTGTPANGEVHWLDRVGFWPGSGTAWDPGNNMLSADQASFENGIGSWQASSPSVATLSRLASGAADGVAALQLTAALAGTMQARIGGGPNGLSANDSDFEGAVGNWVLYNGTSATRSTAQFKTGVASMALTFSGTAGPFAVNDGNSGAGLIPTSPGAQHIMSGYVRASSTTRAFRAVLRWLDVNQVYISQTNGSTVTDSNTGWSALPTVIGAAPAGTAYVAAQVEPTTTPAAAEVHYFDQLWIGLGPDPLLRGIYVLPSTQYTAVASFQAATTGRSVRVRIIWYDDLGAQISTSDASLVSDVVGAFTVSSVTATSPANARYALLEVEVQSAAANEVHLVDKVGLWPGSGSAWSFGGQAPGAAYFVVERNWAAVHPRNLAVPQLWSGGDELASTDGFFTDSPSLLTYDTNQRWQGQGSIRWDVGATTDVLRLGSQPNMADPAPAYVPPAVPGRVYTASIYARAAASFTTRLTIQAVDRNQTAVGSVAQSGNVVLGTSWQRLSVTITVPAGAVGVRVYLNDQAGAGAGQVWVDGFQWELCATGANALSQPGGQATMWFPVRGAGEFLTETGEQVGQSFISGGAEQTTLFDHEVPAGYHVTYRAKVVTISPAGDPVASDWSPYVQTILDPPGQGHWILGSVAAPVYRMEGCVVELEENRHYETAVFYPIRPLEPSPLGQRSVALTDFVGGIDGQLTVTTSNEDDWLQLDRILRSGTVLWLAMPDWGGRYLKVTGQSWTRRRLPADDCTTCPPSQRRWLRQLSLPVVEVGPPS